MQPPSHVIKSLITLCLLALATAAQAHPAPFSYVDLTLEDERISGAVTVHTIDLAHELQIDEPQTLLDEGVLADQYSSINSIVLSRLDFSAAGGARIEFEPDELQIVAGDDAVRLAFHADIAPPSALQVQTALFPYDPAHQTFVNIYEDGELAQQFLFDAGSEARTHYAGTVGGVMAVIATFVPSGAHHVLIGPDHILFIIGLVLLGGGLRRLALIVTAFTLGHSVTLALAALSIFSPPAWLIEPLIALSIVIVGIDNLMKKQGDRDLRPFFAIFFGLVHGFGFAFVLREFGLPDAQLGWSLLAFNVGVEIGQLAIVVPVALVLSALGARRPLVANRIVKLGSLAVIAAGAYWFVDRVLQIGSG